MVEGIVMIICAALIMGALMHYIHKDLQHGINKSFNRSLWRATFKH